MKFIIPKAIISTMALFVLNNCFSQNEYWGTWNNFNLFSHLNNKVSVIFDGQVRSQKIIKNYNYYEINISGGYLIAPKTEVQLGYGRIENYSPVGFYKKPIQNEESRIWEQLSFANTIGVLKIDHRYRIEQQFTSAGYHNRIRYRLNFLLPFNNKSIEKKTLYFNANDEIFIRDKAPYFNQNRLYGGGGYRLTKRFTFQLGWMRINEYFQNNSSTTNKNFLLTSLIADLTFKKKQP